MTSPGDGNEERMRGEIGRLRLVLEHIATDAARIGANPHTLLRLIGEDARAALPDRTGEATQPTTPTGRVSCVYFRCTEFADVAATVLSGDADSMHESVNGLCFRHMYMVVDRWLRELAAGGPVKRMLIVKASPPA